MPDYRIYCLDGAGKISFAEDLRAETDEGAIAKARERKRNTLKCEVWHGAKLIAELDTRDLAG